MTDLPIPMPPSQEADSLAVVLGMLGDGAGYDEVAAQLGMPKASEQEVKDVVRRMERSAT